MRTTNFGFRQHPSAIKGYSGIKPIPNNGSGSVARRLRQIERGTLTASNGLISERTAHIKVNSHGRVPTYCRPCAARVSTPDGPGECDFPNCAKAYNNGCAMP